jgi:hypothetical protein
MRTTIRGLAPNRAVIIEDDPSTSKIIITEYFAPPEGGYVKIDDGNRYPQVCERLSSSGVTLIWDGIELFINLIRREHSRARKRRRRFEASI